MTKKKWATPKLIILVRGKPEEMVLTACKADAEGELGPGVDYEHCINLKWQESECDLECSSTYTS